MSCPEQKLDFGSCRLLSIYHTWTPCIYQHRAFRGLLSAALPTTFCSRETKHGNLKQGHQHSLALNLSLSVTNPSTKHYLYTRPTISRRAGLGDKKTKETRSSNASKTERERKFSSFLLCSVTIHLHRVCPEAGEAGGSSQLHRKKQGPVKFSVAALSFQKHICYRKTIHVCNLWRFFFFFLTLANSGKEKKAYFSNLWWQVGQGKLPSTVPCPHVPLSLPRVSSSPS